MYAGKQVILADFTQLNDFPVCPLLIPFVRKSSLLLVSLPALDTSVTRTTIDTSVKRATDSYDYNF
jgi:hypothetical protein